MNTLEQEITDHSNEVARNLQEFLSDISSNLENERAQRPNTNINLILSLTTKDGVKTYY